MTVLLEAGELLARTRTRVADAALVALARDQDEIWASDPQDMALLARAAGVHVEIVAV